MKPLPFKIKYGYVLKDNDASLWKDHQFKDKTYFL